MSEEAKGKTESNARGCLWAGALLCCGLWGLAPALIKMGYQTLHIETTGAIVLFAGARFFLAGLLVLAFYSMQNRSLPKLRKKPSDRFVFSLCFRRLASTSFITWEPLTRPA